jgi:hypothetical protein
MNPLILSGVHEITPEVADTLFRAGCDDGTPASDRSGRRRLTESIEPLAAPSPTRYNLTGDAGRRPRVWAPARSPRTAGPPGLSETFLPFTVGCRQSFAV